MQVEPLLQENKDRFVIFPIEHHDIWEYYKSDFIFLKYNY